MSATHVLRPESGTLLVKTTRAGMAAKVGHDLTLEAQVWRGQAVVDVTDPSASSVSVEVDVDSLVVLEGTGGIKPLSGSDKREIQRNIQRKILHTDQHPTITFTSTAVSGTGDDFAVEGQLTIAGQTAPVTLHGAVANGRARGSASVVQSRWGLKPFTAFLGALKLDDEVTVEFDVDLS